MTCLKTTHKSKYIHNTSMLNVSLALGILIRKMHRIQTNASINQQAYVLCKVSRTIFLFDASTIPINGEAFHLATFFWQKCSARILFDATALFSCLRDPSSHTMLTMCWQLFPTSFAIMHCNAINGSSSPQGARIVTRFPLISVLLPVVVMPNAPSCLKTSSPLGL